MAWRTVIGGLLGGALLVTGCATKKFVQEEVAKSQERVGSDVGRVDKSLGDEKARVDALQKEHGETRAATEAATRKASEATTAATQAASRADEASAKATDRGHARGRGRGYRAGGTREGDRDRPAPDEALGEPGQAHAHRDLAGAVRVRQVGAGRRGADAAPCARQAARRAARALRGARGLHRHRRRRARTTSSSARGGRRRCAGSWSRRASGCPGSTRSGSGTSGRWPTTRPSRAAIRTGGCRFGSTLRRSDLGPAHLGAGRATPVVGPPAGGGPLPAGVHLTAGRGGLPCLEVATPLARAAVYLQGAHVTAYAPRAAAPVLFLSRASRFEHGVPIRGGIPIVFPWFGRKAGDPAAPLHGPARLAAWSPRGGHRSTRRVSSTSRLGLDGVAAAEWPAGARLRYRVEIGPALRLALEVENRGPRPFVCEEALHTYLAVDDVERISVTGLEGAAFLDETEAFARKRDGAAPLVVRGEMDRIYDETRATCVVRDPAARRRLEIAKTGSEATVVWNPGRGARAARSRARRVAETSLRGVRQRRPRRAVTVAPGARHRLDRQRPQRALARCLRRGFLPGVSPSGILLQVGRDHARGREVDAAATPGTRESGGIGRRAGLRIQWAQSLGGSTPPSRTTPRLGQWHGLFDESRDSRARSL